MNNEIFSGQQEDQQSQDSMDRRQFLQTMLLATGGVLVDAAIPQEVYAEAPITSKPDIVLNEAKHRQIQFEVDKPLSPEAKQVLFAIDDYQKAFNDTMGGGEVVKAGSSKEIKGKTIKDIGRGFEPQRKKFFDAVKANFSGYKETQYSQEALTKIMAYEIPRYLARFGILAKPLYFPSMERGGQKFSSSDLIMDLYKVVKKETVPYNVWGKSGTVDRLYLDGEVIVDGRDISTRRSTFGGQVFFENILFYTKMLQAQADNIAKMSKDAKRDLNRDVLFSNRLILDALGKTVNTKTDAASAALLRVLYTMDSFVGLDDVEKLTLVHETSHLVDFQDPQYVARFKPHETDNTVTWIKEHYNHTIHEEIDGLLGELRYAPRQELAMVSFINTFLINLNREEGEVDLGHYAASEWILKKITERVLQNPEKYGIEISDQSNVSKDNQVLFQLASLLKHKQELNILMDDIMQYHRAHFDEDLAQDISIFSKGLMEKPASGYDIKKLIAPSLIAGGIYMGVSRFLQRRSMGLAENKLRQSLGKGKGTRKLLELVDSLQILEKPTRIDERERQRALRRLIGAAKNNPDLAQALSKFRNLMDGENIKDFEKLKDENI